MAILEAEEDENEVTEAAILVIHHPKNGKYHTAHEEAAEGILGATKNRTKTNGDERAETAKSGSLNLYTTPEKNKKN